MWAQADLEKLCLKYPTLIIFVLYINLKKRVQILEITDINIAWCRQEKGSTLSMHW